MSTYWNKNRSINNLQIRKLAYQKIDTAVQLLQAMLETMATCDGHPLQDIHSSSHWLHDSIQSQIESSEQKV